MKIRDRIWVGVDVGKASHHACAVDAQGTVVVFSTRVANSQSAIQALTARAGKAADEIVWGVDMTSGVAGLLLTLLVATGQPVRLCLVGWSTGWPERSPARARPTRKMRRRSLKLPVCARI